MDNFISIDFGTTACRIGHDDNGSFQLIPNRYSDGKTPLLIERPRSTPLQYRQNEKSLFTFSSIKQKIGFEEEVTFDGRKIHVIDFATDIFRGLRDDAKTYLGGTPVNAVIAVPASFSEKQRAAIRTASEKAGFTYVKLFDESTAAILGSNLINEGKIFSVYALGGGIFTVSVFRIVNGAPKALCHEGDRRLGGQYFDAKLIHYILSILEVGSDFGNIKYAEIHKLKSLVEHLKIGLSKRDSIALDLNIGDYFDNILGKTVGSNINHIFNRTDFERLIQTDIERTLDLTRKAVHGAGLTNDDIESFMLMGGSTKIPLVEKMIGEAFGKKIVRFSDETLLKGATIYGAKLPEPAEERIYNHCEDGEETARKAEKMKPAEALPSKDKDMSWLDEFAQYLIDAQQSWRAGKREEAISHLEDMYQKLRKFIGNIYLRQGEMLIRIDSFDQAINSLEKGLTYEKDDKDIKQAYHKACSSKGAVLLRNGCLIEAKSVIRKGLEIEPSCMGCTKLLQEIEDALRRKQHPGFKFGAGIRSRKRKR